MLGISAYLISIFLGNEALVLATVVVTFALTVVPVFFIQERAVLAVEDALRQRKTSLMPVQR